MTISIQIIALVFLSLLFLLFLPRMIDYSQRLVYGVERGVYLEDRLVERFHRDEVESLLKHLSENRSYFPENSYIIKESGDIVEERPGRIVAFEETINLVFEAEPDKEVEIVLRDIPPYITKALLESLAHVLSSFTTSVGGMNGRAQNIILSTESINNTLLLPGEIFSFNEVVGPPIAERGYKLAPIIVGGEVVPGYGGGICQTATTLYNAALKADLEIVERYRHTMPIDYVAPGMDATIAYDSLDLKIKNNRSTPIIIKGWASYQVSFSIMGLKEE